MEDSEFDFIADKAIGGINKTKGYKWLTRFPYEDRLPEDHEEARLITSNVTKAILRRVNKLGEVAAAQFITDFLYVYNVGGDFLAFNEQVWQLVDASKWIHPRDCESSSDELWMYAVFLIMKEIPGGMDIGTNGGSHD